MLPTLRQDYSHLRISYSLESNLATLAMMSFSATQFHPYSAVSLSTPISLSTKSQSSLIRWHSQSLDCLRSFTKSFILAPCSNTNRITGRTSMSDLGGKLALTTVLIFLVDSAARMAEVGLRRRMLELGLGTSSCSSSAVSLSPRLDLRRLVRSPDQRLFFFLFQSIFLMRCWTRALRSLSSIILLYLTPK